MHNDHITNDQEIHSPENTGTIRSVLFWFNLVAFMSLIVLLFIYLKNNYPIEAAITALSLIPILAAFELNRRGKVQATGNVIVVVLIIMVTALATVGQGIHDIGIIAYPSILLIASLILKKRSIILLTILTVACTGWLIFGQLYGAYTPIPRYDPTWQDFLIVGGVLAITAFFIQSLSNTLHKSLILRSQDLQKRLDIETSTREAEALYRTLVEQTTVVTYRDAADLDGTPLYVSPTIENLLGYTPAEWMSRSDFWHELVHPNDLPTVLQDVENYIRTGKKSVSEYRLQTKDKRCVWVRDESVVITDENGNQKYIHGVFLDITEQKEAELALKQREAILGAVAQTAQLLLKSRNWRTQINDILRLLGEAAGASHVYLFENHRGDDGTMLSSQKYEWVAAGMHSELDNPAYQNTLLVPISGIEDWFNSLSAGKYFYGSAIQYPDYWEKNFEQKGLKTLLDVPMIVNGEWWGIIGFDDFVNDLPWTQAETNALWAAAGNICTAIERQLKDEELRISESKFHLSFHHTFVPMVISRMTDSVILDVNPAFCKATGYSQEEVIGKTGTDLNIWSNTKERALLLELLDKNGVVDEYKTGFRTKSGDIRTGLLSVIKIQFAAESCLLYTVFDISDIDQLLNELKAKNDELQAFTYTVSHDLKAPLVTISGFLGYLEQDTKSGNLTRVNKDIQRIHDAVTKMQRLLNELLELSRIGRLTNTPEVVPFKEIVDEALSLVEGELQQNQVEVKVEAELPSIIGDRARLVQVVQNLVENAAKFKDSQLKPLIEIGVQEKEGERLFYVRDNGLGIEPVYHERIFGLFNKLDASSEGTGIGLALVRRIIEYHGGRIWVESEGLGKGAVFFFTLPG